MTEMLRDIEEECVAILKPFRGAPAAQTWTTVHDKLIQVMRRRGLRHMPQLFLEPRDRPEVFMMDPEGLTSFRLPQ